MVTLRRKEKKAADLQRKEAERLRAIQAEEEKKKQKRQRILHKAEFAFGTLLAIFLFIWSLVGPPWPTEPIFLPGSPSFGSSLDIPFTVSNKSALFSLSNLSIQCQILKIDAEGPAKAAVHLRGPANVAASGAKHLLSTLDTGYFTCPARGIFQVDQKDAVEPDRVTAAEIAFVTEYDSRLLWGRSTSKTNIFTLDTSTVPPQWTQGKSLQ